MLSRNKFRNGVVYYNSQFGYILPVDYSVAIGVH